MSRVRRRGNFHQITPFERGRIVRMHEAGLTFGEIARRVNRSHTTITPTCRDWQEEHIEACRRGTGRRRVTQEREDRLLRRNSVRDPEEPSRAVGINWIRVIIGRMVFTSTIYRRIWTFGLRSYHPYFRLPLTREHKAIRLYWGYPT